MKGLALGLALVVGLSVLALSMGSYPLSWNELLQALLPGQATNPEVSAIVWQLRIPRLLLGLLVGASLACSGAAFQALLRSNLADPYLIGTSAGASLGTVLALLLGLSPAVHPLAGFVGAMAAVSWVASLARRKGVLRLDDFLLAGVMLSTLLGSLVSLLLTLAGAEMARILFFLLGNLGHAQWQPMLWSLPLLLVGLGLLARNAYSLNLLSLGEEFAAPVGVEVERVKTEVLLGASLLTACAVSAAGMVGFVGLVVPHLCRFWAGADVRRLLPLTLVWGAAFLLGCDLLARAVPGELPVGIVTSLLGAPWFLSQLRLQAREA